MEPLTQEVAGRVSTALWLLLAAVGAVLLIGCVNLANLQLARAVTREREMAVRAALGAGSGRLLWSTLMDSLLLAVSGGALGILLSFTGVRLFVAAAPANLPRLDEVHVSWLALLAAAGLSIDDGAAVWPAAGACGRSTSIRSGLCNPIPPASPTRAKDSAHVICWWAEKLPARWFCLSSPDYWCVAFRSC